MEEKVDRGTHQDLILDTCILQYAGSNPSRSTPFLNYLQELQNRNFTLTISEFTFFELLQGTPKGKEAKLAKVLRVFRRVGVTENILVGAAQLASLYQREKIPNSQISEGDKIIATSAILRGALIATSNLNDFPRPFFTEKERKHIFYKKSGADIMVPVYILSPDFDLIKDRFGKRP